MWCRNIDRPIDDPGLFEAGRVENAYQCPLMKPIFYQESSVQNADQGLDMENRAYLMTVAMQRWLAMRLDFLGNLLVLGIALFGAATSKTTNPARTGVVLSYTLA